MHHVTFLHNLKLKKMIKLTQMEVTLQNLSKDIYSPEMRGPTRQRCPSRGLSPTWRHWERRFWRSQCQDHAYQRQEHLKQPFSSLLHGRVHTWRRQETISYNGTLLHRPIQNKIYHICPFYRHKHWWTLYDFTVFISTIFMTIMKWINEWSNLYNILVKLEGQAQGCILWRSLIMLMSRSYGANSQIKMRAIISFLSSENLACSSPSNHKFFLLHAKRSPCRHKSVVHWGGYMRCLCVLFVSSTSSIIKIEYQCNLTTASSKEHRPI